MQLKADFYKRRLQDTLAVGAIDDHGVTSPAVVGSLPDLLTIPDDEEFVRQAYLFFLRREADPDGLEYFLNAARSRGREAVADELKASNEAVIAAGVAARAVAPAISLAAERAEDLRILAKSRSLELTGLLLIPGDEAFVSALYDEVLRRPVDADGLAHHVAQLSQGVTRDAMTQGLASSAEARQAGRQMTWQGRPWPPAPRVNPVRRAIRRLLLGTDVSVAAAPTLHEDAVADRLFHRLADQREMLAGLEGAVAALQRTVDDWRSQLGSLSPLDAEPTILKSVLQRQDQLTRVVASLATDMKQEMRRIQHDNIIASEVDGFIVGVPAEEWRMAAYHQFRGVLEPGLTQRFAESLASGMTVVDIGANIGMYTLIAARGVAPGGRVYSFEPTPRTFAILKDNIQVNGLLETGIVDCRRVAISDRRGTAPLAVYRNNSGHNTLFAGGAGPDMVEVETIALDEALAGVPRVDVIKIDAEGAEALIWNGMQQTLRRNPAVRIFMEFAPAHLRRAVQDPGAFLDRLAADGFRIQRVHDASGELVEETRESLCAGFSANLMLTRATE